MYFYLTNNVNKNEPLPVKQALYIHVKARVDGSQTVIITEDSINDPSCSLLSQQEAQALLNSWIDEENNPPLPQDIAGNFIQQPYINLGNYLA
jgi:hypothetical protein